MSNYIVGKQSAYAKITIKCKGGKKVVFDPANYNEGIIISRLEKAGLAIKEIIRKPRKN